MGTTKSDNFSTSQEEIAYSNYPTIDLNGSAFQNLSVSGAITGLSTINRSANSSEVKSVLVKLTNTGALAFPLSFDSNAYPFLGGVPTGIKAGSTAYLNITSFGTGTNDVVMNYDELGSDLFFPQGAVIFARDYEASGNSQLNFRYPDGLTGVPQLTLSGNFSPNGDAEHKLGTETNSWNFVHGSTLALKEKSSNPPNPAEGNSYIWMSDGTDSGDDGDIMVKITAGGVTKTVTLVDFSAS